MAKWAVVMAMSALAMPVWAADHDETARIHAVIADPAGLKAPGCAVGILREGKPPLRVFAGAADIERQRPIDADTLFYAASITKQFTMLSIAKLVESGKVSLEDDVRKWLPELPDYGTRITVSMLAHHTAGIRNNLALVAMKGLAADSVNRAQALQLLFQQKQTDFKPGTDNQYSNGGYLLLSEIVARASGKSFPEFARETILKPLGMANSRMIDGQRPTGDDVAIGYALVDGKIVKRDDHPLFAGSGGLLTTLSDMEKYARDVQSGHKVWTDWMRRFMLAPGRYTEGSTVIRMTAGKYYGSGMEIGPDWINHGGGTAGFRHMFGYLQQRKLALILFCNRGEVDPLIRSDAVLAALDPTIPPLSTRQPAAKGDGLYTSDELGVTYRLSSEGRALIASPEGASGSEKSFRLEAGADGSFGNKDFTVLFEPNMSGFTLRYQGTAVRFHRIG